MIWVIAVLAVSFALASFCWLLGIWRSDRLTSAVGLALLVFSCLFARGLSGTTDLLNDIGMCVMALGVATGVVGRRRKVTPSKHTDVFSVLFVLLGLYLALLL